MYDRILFPTDGSEGANAVVDHVLEIAESYGATLHILNVADTKEHSITRVEGNVIDIYEREGEQIVQETADRANGTPVETVTDVVQGSVPETIVAYADEYDIDLIAMATYGRVGLEQRVLGSTTERVVRQAPVPTLVLPPENDSLQYPYQTVLVPTDGSECAAVALDAAIAIVNATEATLHLLSVADVSSLGADVRSELQLEVLEEQANDAVAEAASKAHDTGVDAPVEAIEVESAVHRAIDSYVTDHDVDLVVMGTHGRTGLDRYLLGSVTEKTLQTVSVPVLTVPEPE